MRDIIQPSSSLLLLLVVMATVPIGADPLSQSWQQVLTRHTASTEAAELRFVGIDYQALTLGDVDFYTALFELAAREPFGLDLASEKALLINAYNILAVQLVVESWPLSGIKDASSVYGSVWNRPAGQLGGEPATLAEIEARLRELHDPRFHFAIVCASKSCPDLRSEPYSAARLETQLDEQLRSFLANPTKGMRFDPASRTLYLSRLFEWYASEFEAHAPSVLDYVLEASDEATATLIETHRDELTIAYIPYDWGINSSSSAPANQASR